MRKRLLVLLMAAFMVVMSAAPAMAQFKPAQPIYPKGLVDNNGTGFDRPEQAADPTTGRGNKIDHGSPQNGKV